MNNSEESVLFTSWHWRRRRYEERRRLPRCARNRLCNLI